MEVFRGERRLNEIASKNNVHPNMPARWKTEAANNFHILFENENAKIRKQARDYESKIDELYKQIGKLTVRNELMKKSGIQFLSKAADSHGGPRGTDFPVSVQAQMPSLNCSSLYHKLIPSSDWDIQLNRLMDIAYTKHPEFGYRCIVIWHEGCYGFHADKKLS